jgi:hypothetical protein
MEYQKNCFGSFDKKGEGKLRLPLGSGKNFRSGRVGM